MRKARKEFIEAEYNDRVSHNLDVLAKTLGVQLKEVKRWRKEGFISFPIPESEFFFLVKMINCIWGNYTALRCQMTVMTSAKRQNIVRTADLSGFELEVFNYVLRWKLQFPRRYLHFKEARNQLRARFPNGYLQLNAKLLNKAKKAANYEISKARRSGKLECLHNQLGLKIATDGRVKKNHFKDTANTAKSVNSSMQSISTMHKEAIFEEAGENLKGFLQPKGTSHPSGLSEEDLTYLEQNFGDTVANAKKSLEERLKKLPKAQV
jgi:hypothetical protein